MARVVDFEDGFTSETAPTDNDIATQAELDAHINDTTAVHAATSLSLPVTETLYVDKGRADTYTQTGSILAPYKTIQAAINAIQTAADNSDSKPYRIEISAGYYAEDLVISGAGFINVILDGHGAVTVDKLTMSVADAFWTFVCLGMSFADSVSIIGTTDGGTAFASGGEFRSCNFYDVTLKNLCAVYIKDSAIGGPLVVENVISAAIQKGQATGTIANTWAPANPKPGGAPYSYLNLEALVTTGDITISAGAYVQTRIGSRIGLPGGTITVNGDLITYSSYIRAGISVGATGVFTNSGSFYDPSTLSVAGGGTVTKNSKAEVIGNVPSGNLSATNVQDALNELQTDIDTTRPINKGGTGQTTKAAAFDALSPMSASGDIIYGAASGTGTRLAAGTDGQILTLASGLPAWAAPASAPAKGAMTLQKLTSGTTYNKSYTFNIASGSATVGATYTNNGITYTVSATVASATQVVLTGSGAPTASGTLTKASGTGDATLTFTSVLAPLWIEVEAVGAGGGGSGGGSGASIGGAGGNTTFGTITASGGAPSAGGAQHGGLGGSASLGTGPVGVAVTGGTGGSAVVATGAVGGSSASTPFGAGQGGNLGTPAANVAYTGVGGAGGGAGSGGAGGGAGGSGGYVKAIISNPSATYAYAVGAAGSGGAFGTGGGNGQAGSAGIIIVREYYQ